MGSCHIRTIIPIRHTETLRNRNKRREILLKNKSKKENKKLLFFFLSIEYKDKDMADTTTHHRSGDSLCRYTNNVACNLSMSSGR